MKVLYRLFSIAALVCLTSSTLFAQPALVFQGMRDASVDYRTVEQFSRSRPNVTLSLLDDDHQLMTSLPRIWEGMASYLGLACCETA